MTALRKRLIEDMQMRNNSPRTGYLLPVEYHHVVLTLPSELRGELLPRVPSSPFVCRSEGTPTATPSDTS